MLKKFLQHLQCKNKDRTLPLIPASTSPWLVIRKHFVLANKRTLLAILHTIYLQYVFIKKYLYIIINALNDTEDTVQSETYHDKSL